MYSKIIVGSDPRSGGADALALAARLAGEQASIVIGRVYNPELDLTVPETPPVSDARTGVRSVRAQMVPATTPGHGLHRLAREVGADLIVVGSSTRGRASRILLGDDVRQTVRNAPCAVAVAPLGYAEHGGELTVIGVGWDGSAGAHRALAVAREVAGAHHAEVQALQAVVAPSPMLAPGTYPHLDLTTELDRAQQRLTAEGVAGRAVFGAADVELSRWSSALDLLVVGATGHGRLGRLLLGSTPEQLTHGLASPLLVVPPDAADEEGDAEHAPAGAGRSAVGA